MSDFFVRLGQRALGVRGDIRPAVAPLFPARFSPRLAMDADPPPGNDVLDEATGGADAPMTATRSPLLRPSPEDFPPSHAPASATVPSLPVPERPALRATAAPGIPAGASTPLRMPRDFGPTLYAVLAPEGVSPSTVDRDTDRPPASPGHGTVRAREDPQGAGAPLRGQLLRPDHGRDGALSIAAEREVAAALSRLRRLDSTPAPSGSDPEERMVRIHIGRLDVRAAPVFPAAGDPPRRREPSRPTPSLAEYLTRKGRERS